MRAGLQVSLSSSRAVQLGQNSVGAEILGAFFFLSLSLNNHLILTRWWARFCTTEEKKKEKKNKVLFGSKFFSEVPITSKEILLFYSIK